MTAAAPCRQLPGVPESASQHLEQLEGSRKLFSAAGALSIAQRQLLYAHDELAMALLRISTRMEGEQVRAEQQHADMLPRHKKNPVRWFVAAFKPNHQLTSHACRSHGAACVHAHRNRAGWLTWCSIVLHVPNVQCIWHDCW